MIQDNFAKEFVTELSGKIPEEDLGKVLQELLRFTSDYTIEKKCRDLIPKDQIIPQCYKIYLVSMKIEGKSPDTLKTYDYYLRDFFLHIGRPLEKITTNDIRVYLYETQKRTGISNHTLEGKRVVIHTFLEWCRSEGYIADNPVSRITPIRYEEKEREPLSNLELEMLRDACKDYREKALVEMFYSTGCRVSELVNLKLSDIDMAEKEVHLLGKGNKHRTTYLNAKAELYLKKYLETRHDSSDSVFVTEMRPYRGLKKTAIESVIRKIGERSDIDRRVYPHLIRHTTATDALSRGMSVTEVQKILGHVKLSTTMIYAKVSQSAVKYDHHKYVV